MSNDTMEKNVTPGVSEETPSAEGIYTGDTATETQKNTVEIDAQTLKALMDKVAASEQVAQQALAVAQQQGQAPQGNAVNAALDAGVQGQDLSVELIKRHQDQVDALVKQFKMVNAQYKKDVTEYLDYLDKHGTAPEGSKLMPFK